jgi:hypothetical protein
MPVKMAAIETINCLPTQPKIHLSDIYITHLYPSETPRDSPAPWKTLSHIFSLNLQVISIQIIVSRPPPSHHHHSHIIGGFKDPSFFPSNRKQFFHLSTPASPQSFSQPYPSPCPNPNPNFFPQIDPANLF